MDFDEMTQIARSLKEKQVKQKTEEEQFEDDIKNLAENFELDEEELRNLIHEKQVQRKEMKEILSWLKKTGLFVLGLGVAGFLAGGWTAVAIFAAAITCAVLAASILYYGMYS